MTDKINKKLHNYLVGHSQMSSSIWQLGKIIAILFLRQPNIPPMESFLIKVKS